MGGGEGSLAGGEGGQSAGEVKVGGVTVAVAEGCWTIGTGWLTGGVSCTGGGLIALVITLLGESSSEVKGMAGEKGFILRRNRRLRCVTPRLP